MLVTPHKPPLRFDPAEEKPEAGEDKINQEFIDTFRDIQETVLKDSGHAERAVHAKAWGLFEGELTVFDDLLPDYAQGIFAVPGAIHPVIMRLSSIPGDILDDEITVPHGLAVKVLNVEGERLPGSDGHATQDFVLVNGPAFNTPNAKMFLANLKMLAATTDKAEGLKKGASVVNRGLEALIEAFGGESRTLKSLGGAPMTNPLGDVFYSQTPFRYGDFVAKISVAPVSANLVALADKPEDVKGKPDGFRDIVVDEIAQNGGGVARSRATSHRQDDVDRGFLQGVVSRRQPLLAGGQHQGRAAGRLFRGPRRGRRRPVVQHLAWRYGASAAWLGEPVPQGHLQGGGGVQRARQRLSDA